MSSRPHTPHPVRGTQDMLGDTADRFTFVVETFERVRKLYGFKRVEVPVIEPTAVFARSLGETTDVVSKEMYSFEDRGGDSITLRPEFTAGIARAYITNGWQQHGTLKLATHGPLFRYERPQKGRYRQFHQLDAEILAASEPMADVELLCFADHLLRKLGIVEGVTLQLNTLGDAESRDAWRAALVAHFNDHAKDLSAESQARLATNPMRILDSKEAQDRPIADSAPDIDAFLTAEAQEFFGAVKDGLNAAGVKFERNARLVRGLDYYRHTAFEFVTDRLGAQGTVLGGGRYDGLVAALGGPDTQAVGWAAGIERLAMLVGDVGAPVAELILIPSDEATEELSFDLLNKLRRADMSTEIVSSGAFGKRYDKARKSGSWRGLSIEPHAEALAVARLRDLNVSGSDPAPIRKRIRDALSKHFTYEETEIANAHSWILKARISND